MEETDRSGTANLKCELIFSPRPGITSQIHFFLFLTFAGIKVIIVEPC